MATGRRVELQAMTEGSPTRMARTEAQTPNRRAIASRVAKREAGPVLVTIVNDYEVIVRGVAAILAPYADRIRVVEFDVGAEPIHRADVALFDTFASYRNSLVRAEAMINDGVVRHVILYTWDVSAKLERSALAIGVSGIVFKSQTGPELVQAIESVWAGRKVGFGTKSPSLKHPSGMLLSPREEEVLMLIAAGYANREIAAELFVSIDTVKTHIRRVFEKLGVTNRAQAAVMAMGNRGPVRDEISSPPTKPAGRPTR